jgi:hypothetical protein
MDRDPVDLLLFDRIPGDGASHHMDFVSAAGEFSPLFQGLAFRAAGEGVEIAYDVADADPPSFGFRQSRRGDRIGLDDRLRLRGHERYGVL